MTIQPRPNAAPADSARPRRDIAADITGKILSELASGVLPWRKPWDGARVGPVLPRRPGGENYRGVNILILWSATIERRYASPYRLTFKPSASALTHWRPKS